MEPAESLFLNAGRLLDVASFGEGLLLERADSNSFSQEHSGRADTLHMLNPLSATSRLAFSLAEWAVFLIPTFVAIRRKRRNLWKIVLANVFLGPLIIPWFFVLRSAFKDPAEPITENYICTNCHTVAVPLARKKKWFFGEGAHNAARIYEGLVPDLKCPMCSAANPIPLSSPAGQELYSRSAAYREGYAPPKAVNQ